MILTIHLDNPFDRTIRRAVDCLSNGGLIVYPTDTVYGLGCSIENKSAIERVHLIKHQKQDKPFSFVCSDLKHVSEYAHVGNAAFKVMKRMIPGPYTFILPSARMKNLPKILVSKRKTVGIRVPASRVVQDLVAALGYPILSTSVTDSEGNIMADAEQIHRYYGHAVDLVLDGGPGGLEPSTILDMTGERVRVVRLGLGSVDDLEF